MTNFLKHFLLVTIFLLPFQQLQATGDNQTSWKTCVLVGVAVTGGAYYCSNYISNFFKMPTRVDNIKKDTGQIIQRSDVLLKEVKNNHATILDRFKLLDETIVERSDDIIHRTTTMMTKHITDDGDKTRDRINVATQNTEKALGDKLDIIIGMVNQLQDQKNRASTSNQNAQ